VAARTRELVPLNYFHVVFTVPHELSELMLQNKRLLYDLLFRTVADTPTRLGAEIGFLGVLHTWGQTASCRPRALRLAGTAYPGTRPGVARPAEAL
jgi:hypothetical protein